MKKVFLSALVGMMFVGAGCVSTNDGRVMQANTSTGSEETKTAQGTETTTTTIEAQTFTLALSSGQTYEARTSGGRYQNFVAEDGPQALGEEEYFVEFSTNTYSDLEFNNEFEKVTSVILGNQPLDRGVLKSEYAGGDTTKYIVGYFRSGDASHASTVVRIYADTQSGIAAGEVTLKDIQWKE